MQTRIYVVEDQFICKVGESKEASNYNSFSPLVEVNGRYYSGYAAIEDNRELDIILDKAWTIKNDEICPDPYSKSLRISKPKLKAKKVYYYPDGNVKAITEEGFTVMLWDFRFQEVSSRYSPSGMAGVDYLVKDAETRTYERKQGSVFYSMDKARLKKLNDGIKFLFNRWVEDMKSKGFKKGKL